MQILVAVILQSQLPVSGAVVPAAGIFQVITHFGMEPVVLDGGEPFRGRSIAFIEELLVTLHYPPYESDT